jgi:flagellar motor switch protein FliM
MADAADLEGSVRPFDLVSEYNPTGSRLAALEPTLERIDSRFARQFRSALLQHLRRELTVKHAGIELIKHSEVLGRIGEPSHLTLVNMKPLRGTTLVVMDAPLASTIMEARFGGSSRFPTALAKREFTPLELKVLSHILEMVLEQFASTWEPFALFEPSVVRYETNRQFASFATADELIIVSAFDISIDRSGGRLTTCVPYVSLEPLHPQLMSSIAEDSVNYESLWYDTLKLGVEQAEITVSAELGSIEVNVSDLIALRPGDVFEMDRPDTVVVEASGVPLFRGKWGRHGRKIAVRIEERLDKDDS